MLKKKISQELQYNIREYIEYYFQEQLEFDQETESRVLSILPETLKK